MIPLEQQMTKPIQKPILFLADIYLLIRTTIGIIIHKLIAGIHSIILAFCSKFVKKEKKSREFLRTDESWIYIALSPDVKQWERVRQKREIYNQFCVFKNDVSQKRCSYYFNVLQICIRFFSSLISCTAAYLESIYIQQT